MREMELRYLSNDVAERIEQMVEDVVTGRSTDTIQNFVDKITELLPINKLQSDTVRRRVEGYYLTTEMLWQKARDLSKGTRSDVVRMANLKPLSHYHYMTGSREPHNIVMTRDDYMNDPPTAMVKLRDDIYNLAGIFPELRKKASTAE